jgi:hypothetical protein
MESVLDASDPAKLRFRLVEWLAAAPDRETYPSIATSKIGSFRIRQRCFAFVNLGMWADGCCGNCGLGFGKMVQWQRSVRSAELSQA